LKVPNLLCPVPEPLLAFLWHKYLIPIICENFGALVMQPGAFISTHKDKAARGDLPDCTSTRVAGGQTITAQVSPRFVIEDRHAL